MKRTLTSIAVLILLAAVINVPLALQFVTPPGSPGGRTIANVIGPGAASHKWPAATPHPHPWPTITQWQAHASFGHWRGVAWASDAGRTTTHQMQHDLYGWPLPVLQQTSRWWPWSDPAWALPAATQETGLRLYWPGVLLNPLIFGLGAWLVLFAPGLFWRHRLSRRRLRRGQCPACGYPAGASGVCTECGRPLPASLQPAAPGPGPGRAASAADPP